MTYNQHTTEKFVEMSMLMHGSKYDYSKVVYSNSKNKVEIICKEHGEFWQIAGNHIHKIKKAGCPKCGNINRSKSQAYTKKDFIEIANKIHNFKYIYDRISYVNSDSELEIICPKHGSFFQIAYAHTSNMSGCPKCNSSKGEAIIREWLNRNGVDFTEQKTFDNCKNKKLLPFDFYLCSKNILLEYDGEHHFGLGKFATKNVAINDKIKNKFTEQNKIKLIRIPYTEFKNIEKILEDSIT